MALRLPRLLDPQTLRERARLQPVRMRLEQRLNRVATAALTLPRGAESVRLGDLAELFDGAGESAGLFRCYRLELNGRTGGQEAVFEHVMAFLGEEAHTGWSAPEGTSCAAALASLLALQAVPRFVSGGADFSVGCAYDLEPGSLLDAIRAVGATLPGDWMLRTDCAAFPWTLRLAALSQVPSCELRLRRNILDVRSAADTRGLVTRVYPVGRDGLTLPEGFLDAPSVSEWGVRSRVIRDGSIRRVSHLRAFGQAALSRLSSPALSLRCSAADLSSVTGEPLDRLRLGACCRVCTGPEGPVLTGCVSALTWPDLVSNPSLATVWVARREPGISEALGRDARG